MQNNQAIFESLFNRNFADAQHTGFLEEITAKHPYFSPAQFFLLQQSTGTAAFEKQAAKTNIFFNNPHWLNFQLQQTNTVTEPEQLTTAITSTEPELVLEPAVVADTPEPVFAEEIPQLNPQIPAVETANPVLERHDPVSEPANNNDSGDADDTDAIEPGSHEQEKEIEPMSITLKMPEEKTNLPEAMLFEPMHMVDYFASQGIKLAEDVQTGDKLGRQLKSFTEWLKTMKKVHVPDETETAAKSDSSIQVLAENSNAEAEVLTESMAEVFARQGKLAKATEVYQKLSLLNPAKSTYFAAKIENLKES